MKVRIVKQPPEPLMDGFSVGGRFQVGSVYDLSMLLAQYLIVSGFAIAEMRVGERAGHEQHTRNSSR